MGPIEVLVVTYPDAGLVAGAAPLLRDLVDAGHVRVADALVVTHGPDARMLVTDPDDDLAAGERLSVDLGTPLS